MAQKRLTKTWAFGGQIYTPESTGEIPDEVWAQDGAEEAAAANRAGAQRDLGTETGSVSIDGDVVPFDPENPPESEAGDEAAPRTRRGKKK